MISHSDTSVVTIDRFIIEQEARSPEATGELSGILYDLALAAKMIANKVRRAGLIDILGAAGSDNVQGEHQQKLDLIANEIIVKAMDHGGRLCAMASEEEQDVIPIPNEFRCGKYVLLFDPLDGSSNIDVNVPGRTASRSTPPSASSCFRTPTFAFPRAGATSRSTMPTSNTGRSRCAR